MLNEQVDVIQTAQVQRLPPFRAPVSFLGLILVNSEFVFGLIHGFGLSTRLQQLPLGDEKLPMLFRILSFNIGVELGQVLALGAMLVILKSFRDTEGWKKFSKFANVSLIAAGIFLFFMQSHGYWHQSAPEDFPLNKDDHNHIHIDMQAEELEEFK